MTNSEKIYEMETILSDLKDNYDDLHSLFAAHDDEIPISINVLDTIGEQIDELLEIVDQETDDEN